MKMLLDVGARNGESLEEFVRWDFDVIHAFEPMPEQFANVERIDDPRIEAHNFGLSDVTGPLAMYGSDQWGEASVFPSKVDLDSSVVSECEFVRASEFFAEHVPDDATVFVKFNCEGSEIAILHDLLDSGEFWKIDAFRVEFDISRCVGHEGEADGLLARLAEVGFSRYTIGSDARLENGRLVDRVPQVGTHHERLHAWLESVF